MGDPQGGPFDYGGPRGAHEWSIEDIDWDPNEVRGEPRQRQAASGPDGNGSQQQQQQSEDPQQQQGQALLRRQQSGVGSVISEGAAASGGGSAGGGTGEVPVILEAAQDKGVNKRRMPMTCQVRIPSYRVMLSHGC